MNNQLKNTAMILWLALLGSHLVLLAIVVTGQIKPTMVMDNKMVLMVTGFTAIVPLLASRLINLKAKRFTQGNSLEDHTRGMTFYILSWALGESTSILGLVFFMMAPAEYSDFVYSFFAAGIAMHILNKPSFNSLDSIPRA